MLHTYLPIVQRANHYIALVATVCMIVMPPMYSGLAWAEVVSWPTLNVTLADGTVHNACIYLGIIVSFIGIVIFALVPGNKRVLALEQTHRNFQININDIEKAYRSAHVEDRNGVFRLAGEFEGVRERFEHLKSNPEFEHFEPEILSLAAKMSYHTRDLAQAFNNETVSRAEDFLKQRNFELTRGEERIAAAREVLTRVKTEARSLALAEQVQDSQISRIISTISEELAPLGFQATPKPSTVIEFTTATPAE